MKITIRLHRQHDMDLISIYKNSSFQFAKEAKRALIAYAAGQAYQIPEPDWSDAEYGYVPGKIVFRITLNENKPAEAKAIALLESLHKGYRCSFMKALIRNSLMYLPLAAYAGEGAGYIMSSKANEASKPQMRVRSTVIKTKAQRAQEAAAKQIQTPVAPQSAVQQIPVLNPNVIVTPPEPVKEEPVAVTEPEQAAKTPVAVEQPKPVAPQPEEQPAETNDDLDLDALFMQMGSIAHQ